MIEVDCTHITAKQIEDMLFLITAHAGKIQAKRFNKLFYEQKQKVTLLLRKRAHRARKYEQPLDFFIVREVIDDATNGRYHF